MLITKRMEITDETMRNLALNVGYSLAKTFSAGAMFGNLYWQADARENPKAYVGLLRDIVKQMAQEIAHYSFSVWQTKEGEARFVHDVLYAAFMTKEVKDNIAFMYELQKQDREGRARQEEDNA